MEGGDYLRHLEGRIFVCASEYSTAHVVHSNELRSTAFPGEECAALVFIVLTRRHNKE